MCVLSRNNGQYNAATGSAVTVCVVAGATSLVSATYNDAAVPVNGNCTTFTVVAGTAVLYVTLAGPQDDVQIVEDCGGGQTQVLFAYEHDYHPIVGFAIVGA
ncbi:MAG TPA: hypothetical protein VN999_14625 [Thermoanaerobaculia bacterium]|nr:hypothetical protein [Thermoanaerobaculia bacterium]